MAPILEIFSNAMQPMYDCRTHIRKVEYPHSYGQKTAIREFLRVSHEPACGSTTTNLVGVVTDTDHVGPTGDKHIFRAFRPGLAREIPVSRISARPGP